MVLIVPVKLEELLHQMFVNWLESEQENQQEAEEDLSFNEASTVSKVVQQTIDDPLDIGLVKVHLVPDGELDEWVAVVWACPLRGDVEVLPVFDGGLAKLEKAILELNLDGGEALDLLLCEVPCDWVPVETRGWLKSSGLVILVCIEVPIILNGDDILGPEPFLDLAIRLAGAPLRWVALDELDEECPSDW